MRFVHQVVAGNCLLSEKPYMVCRNVLIDTVCTITIGLCTWAPPFARHSLPGFLCVLSSSSQTGAYYSANLLLDELTRSRNAFPGLKCGLCLPATATDSPVDGLRPVCADRWCRLKLPKRRISILSPDASVSLKCFSINLTALSTSCLAKSGCFWVRIVMS